MSYTKNDWTDILPAAVKAKLDLAETGIKYVNDERDKESAPGRALVEAATAAAQRTALGLGTAALAGDASESAKGVVQLGATGVPSATKVPKALGADLVALITAAGYSLSPAEGTASLDGIADGTTYKRVLAAIATALNAGTYDAPKCTAFGIGGTVLPLLGEPDNKLIGGFYKDYGNYAHSPFYLSMTATVIVMPYSATDVVQVAFSTDATYSTINHSNIAYRTTVDGGSTWSTWFRMWNSSADGNGGQPPAAKSNKTSNATIGWFDAIDVASGASATLPSGGQFEWWIPTYGATYNSVKSGISAGGALSGTASANLTIYYKRLRA